MIRRAVIKPVGIEFCKFDKDSISFLKEWLGDSFRSYSKHKDYSGSIVIKTLNGFMEANEGDYIIKGVRGDFQPCKPDIFLASYDIEVFK